MSQGLEPAVSSRANVFSRQHDGGNQMKPLLRLKMNSLKYDPLPFAKHFRDRVERHSFPTTDSENEV